MYARGTEADAFAGHGQNLKQNHRGHYVLIRVMEYFERSDDGKKKKSNNDMYGSAALKAKCRLVKVQKRLLNTDIHSVLKSVNTRCYPQ